MTQDFRIRVDLQVDPWLRLWNQLRRDQIPFALAAALTGTAKRAQKRVRRELPRRFTIRSKWTAKGIQIVPARKRDFPRTEAIIGTRDSYMVDQETGEDRGAGRGKFRAIPTRRVQRKSSGAVRRPQTPRRLIETGKAFFGDRSIVLRNTRRTTHQAPVMYLLRRRVSMRPRFGFRATVEDTAARTLQPEFRRRLQRALQTSK